MPSLLQSVEEDRLGQELRVVWELELGQIAAPNRDCRLKSIPNGSTTPTSSRPSSTRSGGAPSPAPTTRRSRRRSAAARTSRPTSWSRSTGAARRPAANLLLADDVGLGKTIEAGLVIQELLLRHRARTVIVVCPAGLDPQVAGRDDEKFGLDFTVVNSETMQRRPPLPRPPRQPVHAFPRIIVSMAWLPGQRAQRLAARRVRARQARRSPRFAFDILVVDEAHHVAP